MHVRYAAPFLMVLSVKALLHPEANSDHGRVAVLIDVTAGNAAELKQRQSYCPCLGQGEKRR